MLRTKTGNIAKQISPLLSRNFSTRGPINTIINFVPQQSEWQIERYGKFNRTAQSGLNIVYPVIEKIAYVRSLKEQKIDISPQSVFTKDNVNVALSGSVYFKIIDSYKASYNIEDYEGALQVLAFSAMRKSIGNKDLDTLFKERDALNSEIVESLRLETKPWGIELLRYEIQDVNVTNRETLMALQRQSDAERIKRAEILESEGKRQAKINLSEGEKVEVINKAEAEAASIRIKAAAAAEGINKVAEAINKEGGKDAVAQQLASEYIKNYSKMFSSANTVIVPSNPLEVSSLITTGLSIFEEMRRKNQNQNLEQNEIVAKSVAL